jgi:hypothetical protein
LIGWNSAIYGGGIAMVNYADAIIVNNVIVSNTASWGYGGGIYVDVPSGHAGPWVVNNTIVDNNGSLGSGVYSDGFDTAALYANNIIVAFSNQTAFYAPSYEPGINYNDLFSRYGKSFDGFGSNPIGTNGNISADPLFANAALRNYHLWSASPAIDAGYNGYAPTNDLDAVLRPYDGNGDGTNQVDLGAYEWMPIQAKLLVPTINTNQQPYVSWISIGGVRYRVQYSDGTQGGFTGAFTDIVRSISEEIDPHPNGVASVMNFTDTNSPLSVRSRFYRIQTLSQ